MYVVDDGINEVLSGIRTRKSTVSLGQQEQANVRGERAINWEKKLKDRTVQAELPRFMSYSVHLFIYWATSIIYMFICIDNYNTSQKQQACIYIAVINSHVIYINRPAAAVTVKKTWPVSKTSGAIGSATSASDRPGFWDKVPNILKIISGLLILLHYLLFIHICSVHWNALLAVSFIYVPKVLQCFLLNRVRDISCSGVPAECWTRFSLQVPK